MDCRWDRRLSFEGNSVKISIRIVVQNPYHPYKTMKLMEHLERHNVFVSLVHNQPCRQIHVTEFFSRCPDYAN